MMHEREEKQKEKTSLLSCSCVFCVACTHTSDRLRFKRAPLPILCLSQLYRRLGRHDADALHARTLEQSDVLVVFLPVSEADFDGKVSAVDLRRNSVLCKPFDKHVDGDGVDVLVPVDAKRVLFLAREGRLLRGRLFLFLLYISSHGAFFACTRCFAVLCCFVRDAGEFWCREFVVLFEIGFFKCCHEHTRGVLSSDVDKVFLVHQRDGLSCPTLALLGCHLLERPI